MSDSTTHPRVSLVRRAIAITVMTLVWWVVVCVPLAMPAASVAQSSSGDEATGHEDRGIVCGNLIYANDRSSRCFSSKFLELANDETHIRANPTFEPVRADSAALFNHPLVVMTGERAFELTDGQRAQLRRYLTHGGFLIASAGCSDMKWTQSFRAEIARVLPDAELKTLPETHPAYHLIYQITPEKYGNVSRLPRLEGVVIEGRTVLVFSADGLNDTKGESGECCCCGGSEIDQSRQMNVNLLAYALTH